MAISNEKHLDQQSRLLAIREYLHVRALPDDQEFVAQVVEACVEKVRPIIDSHLNSKGEIAIGAIADDLGICFEEVKTTRDIQDLEQKYLVEQRELGFGMLAQELSDPNVDALLFQRLKASENAPDRWVAVINSQGTAARAYWSRPHEIVHRLAEPPQQRLPFFRHRTDHESRIERIIDFGAAELAFPKSTFGRLVQGVSNRELTWELVEKIRKKFAPTASLQATAKAFLKFWPVPAFLLIATVRGRIQRPNDDVALRIDIDGFNSSAQRTDVLFVKNMRVPITSPIMHTYMSNQPISEHENLDNWTTSRGYMLPSRRAFTSGVRFGKVVYALVSLD